MYHYVKQWLNDQEQNTETFLNFWIKLLIAWYIIVLI